MSSYKVSENDLIEGIAEDIAQIDKIASTNQTIEASITDITSTVDTMITDVDGIQTNITGAKTNLASAISVKTGSTYTNTNTFDELVVGINSIKTNVDGSMTGKGAATYQPSTSAQVIAGGQYLEGDQTISPVGGTANRNDVLSGKTFSSGNGIDLSGSIPSLSALTYNPSIIDQIISAGNYLSGDITIKAVTGTADTPHVLSGKTFSSSYGIDLTGSMENLNDGVPRQWAGYEICSLQVHPEAYNQGLVTFGNGYGPVGYYGRNSYVRVNIANLYPDVIQAGVRVGRSELYGADDTNSIVGTFTSDANAASNNLLAGATAYVNGAKVEGTIPWAFADRIDRLTATTCIVGPFDQDITGDTTNYLYLGLAGGALNPGSYNYNIYHITHPEPDLLPENILSGKNICGVDGTLVTSLSARAFDIPGYIGGSIYVPGWVFYNGVYYVIVTVHDPTTSLYIYRYNPNNFTFVYLNRIYTAPYYPLNYMVQGCCAVYGNKIIFIGNGWGQTTDAKYVYDMDANTFTQYVLPRQVFPQTNNQYITLAGGRMLGYRGNIAYLWTSMYIIPLALDDSPTSLFTELTNLGPHAYPEGAQPIATATPILYDNDNTVYYLRMPYEARVYLMQTQGSGTTTVGLQSVDSTNIYDSSLLRIVAPINERMYLMGPSAYMTFSRIGATASPMTPTLPINGVGTMIVHNGVSMMIYPSTTNQIYVQAYSL